MVTPGKGPYCKISSYANYWLKLYIFKSINEVNQ